MKKAIIVILSLLSIIACCFGAAACAAAPKIQLSAPENLQIDGRILTWDEVENAEGYIVSIDGEQTAVETNNFVLLTLTGPRTYCIEVAARGEGKFTDSAYSVTQITTQAPVEQGYDEEEFRYTLLEDGTGYELKRGFADLQGEVYLPDFFNGYPVKRIAFSAFSVYEGNYLLWPDPYTGEFCNTLTTSFRLPAYLEEIGECAFLGCTKIEEIVIPDTVTSIEAGAFWGCIGLKRVTFSKELKTIAHMCFELCPLEELVLPDGLEKIGNNAFRTTEQTSWGIKYKPEPSVTKLVIPDTVTEIGDFVFSGWSYLSDITLPQNLQYMGKRVFHETAWFENQPEGWVTIRGDILYGYKGESHIAEGAVMEIPSHIKYIAEIFSGYYALGDMLLDQQNLAGVIIPDGVKFLGERVFAGCSSLTSVRLPADLKVIPAYTFYMCPNLEQIDIPDGVTEIADCAFSGTALESVVIPSSVTVIGNYVFGSTLSSTWLTEVFYKGTAEQWAKIIFEEHDSTVDSLLEAIYGKSEDSFIKATKYFYSESAPADDGNYWHYIDGEIWTW